ncbi:MAG: DUF3054 domain-containing protein [Chloroflexi bacterium]|nr:DUF3054 domain-containing protein [Chloroflexota bacterium]
MADDTVQPESLAHANWLPRWEVYALGIGDMLALIVFAAVGRASHGVEDIGPVLGTLNTALPFIVGWVIAGAATGHYRGLALYPIGRVILRTVLTGLVATPLAIGLRAFALDELPPLSFVLVAGLSSTVLVLLWRIFWSRLRLWWWRELPG